MKNHLYIITGASRGMGLGIAQALLKPGNQLLCISRKTNDALAQSAIASGVSLEQWPLDLSHGEAVSAQLHQWLSAQSATPFASVTLINNAAILPPVSPLRDVPYAAIASCLRIGLEAPMQLTAAFLNATQDWVAPRKVLNISSGNGRRAMGSQASYSAAKAGMDHYSRCVAIEESLKPNGAKICSLAPGVIDTDMQTHLRDADPNAFPDHGMFLKLQSEGVLLSPQDAGIRVLAYLNRVDFGTHPVADVRD
ncbi:MAG: SDR family NAD(P)-dependent oxidoreductase [Betaproteobacteria bacterium]|nr:MAG: SDR family NAD(P)-dependent oxidoreductase [Betaproteobacteria bacterium]